MGNPNDKGSGSLTLERCIGAAIEIGTPDETLLPLTAYQRGLMLQLLRDVGTLNDEGRQLLAMLQVAKAGTIRMVIDRVKFDTDAQAPAVAKVRIAAPELLRVKRAELPVESAERTREYRDAMLERHGLLTTGDKPG